MEIRTIRPGWTAEEPCLSGRREPGGFSGTLPGGLFEDHERGPDEKRETVAVVAHGGTLMSVLSAFAVPEKPFYDWQVKNGRGFLLEVPEDFPEKRELTVLESL
mgnify:CR=1 FL=1